MQCEFRIKNASFLLVKGHLFWAKNIIAYSWPVYVKKPQTEIGGMKSERKIKKEEKFNLVSASRFAIGKTFWNLLLDKMLERSWRSMSHKWPEIFTGNFPVTDENKASLLLASLANFFQFWLTQNQSNAALWRSCPRSLCVKMINSYWGFAYR